MKPAHHFKWFKSRDSRGSMSNDYHKVSPLKNPVRIKWVKASAKILIFESYLVIFPSPNWNFRRKIRDFHQKMFRDNQKRTIEHTVGLKNDTFCVQPNSQKCVTFQTDFREIFYPDTINSKIQNFLVFGKSRQHNDSAINT